MRSGDPYRDTARELLERTGNHPNAQQRAKLETTAAEWLRLADEADRSDRLTINFELSSLKDNEAKFPHHIDMMAPESGFGSLLNAMHDWHDARSIEAVRGQSRHENARYIIRWCFADLVTAALFQKEFGDK